MPPPQTFTSSGISVATEFSQSFGNEMLFGALSAASFHGCYSHGGDGCSSGEPGDTVCYCSYTSQMARRQGHQGGKCSGHETPVQRKELKYRFSPLNNHFTKGMWGTMYSAVGFLTGARVLFQNWAFLHKPAKFLAESLRCRLLKILIQA